MRSCLAAAGAALCLVIGLRSPALASAAGRSPSALEAAVADAPYDWGQRRLLVSQYYRAGDYASAYYHAAWLAWLGPGEEADAPLGGGFLRDRGNRDRAASSDAPEVAAIVAAVDAERGTLRTCLNGAIAQVAGRLVADATEQLARAQNTEAHAGRNDAVVRIAVARACLALDDALWLDGSQGSARRRAGVLRAAASRADAVSAWYPEAPGAHRTLAVIRARLADLDGRAELWNAAIAEVSRAQQLDPGDPHPLELLWSLHLRAGHWPEAAAWQKMAEAAATRSAR